MEVVGTASVPPPALETVTVWDGGFAAPTVAVNESDAAESPMAGGAVTVNDTAKLCGVLAAPTDATDTVAVYVPAARPAVAGWTAME